MSIVVVDVSSELSGRVAAHLHARGVPADRIVVVQDAAGTATPLAAGDTLLLVRRGGSWARRGAHTSVLAAAREAGVRRLVHLSVPRIGSAPVARDDAFAAEEELRATGLPVTLLRANLCTDDFRAAIIEARDNGQYIAASGDGRVASATLDEYAEAAAVVLGSEGHDGAVYELAGDTAWSGADMAAALSDLIDREVRFTDLEAETLRERLLARGVPEETADGLVALDRDIRDGRYADVPGDLSTLIGRPTAPLLDVLRALLLE